MARTISIVAPFYNESTAIKRFEEAMDQLTAALPDYQFEIVCVDDGSSDDTLHQLVSIAGKKSSYVIVELSRNFGKEAALTAGIDISTGDAVIPIDADLQDPPSLIPQMIKAWEEGSEVVLARRADRSVDTVMKRASARWFYKLHNLVSKPKIPENVGDFRLMDRKVVEALKRLPERQRFMKGLFAWVGFRTSTIDYERAARSSGETKFSGWRLWNFALEGLTSFTTVPLRIWTYVGLIGAAISCMFALFVVARTLFIGVDTPGYASLLVAVTLLGFLQIMTIGIVGEYVGRIYNEVKQRPNYVIRELHKGK